jgi:hypothetical protein
MTIITLILLATSLLSLIILAMIKSIGRSWEYSYVFARGSIGLLGIGIFFSGLVVSQQKWSYSTLISPFSYITGVQIFFWAIGFGDELLGNIPQIAANNAQNSGTNNILVVKKSRPTESASILFAILFAALCFFVFINDRMRFVPWLLTPTDIGFIKQVSIDTILPEKPTWISIPVSSTDSYGEKVEVNIGILWDPYRWVRGSAEYVAIDESEKNRIRVEDIVKDFERDEKRPIVAVGVASHENAIGNPEVEIKRAKSRADKLVDICSSHFNSGTHIYSMNLGAYMPSNGSSRYSASERRVILLVINKGENSRDLTSGIKNALIQASKTHKYLIDPNYYSLFNTTMFELKREKGF